MSVATFAGLLAAFWLSLMLPVLGDQPGNLSAFDTAPNSTAPPTPPAQRLVGIAYSTWHQSEHWTNVWGTPELGFYKSDNRTVIRQHAAWLGEAGVDFVWIDWSNNLGYRYDPKNKRPDFDMIEDSTFIIFDEFSKLRTAGKKTPKISIFIGNPGEPEAITNGHLQRKADQVWNQFVAHPLFRPVVQEYLGKPLLVVYVNTPSPYQNSVPTWSDPRFTVRYMTGFITQQHPLRTPGLVSKYGYWSWEDRGPQTYPIFHGHPEAMTVVATWRDDPEAPTPGRRGGETFRREWERTRKIGPRFALVVSWNEWTRGEQPSPEVSKDIEPSQEFGHRDLDILKAEVAKFKRGE